MTIPCSIKIFEDAFRRPNFIDQFKNVLSENVEMLVTGTQVQAKKTNPENVISLFQSIVHPANTVLKGCLFSATLSADNWVVVVGLARNQNMAVNNCVIRAICTLWRGQISRIEMYVEPSTSKVLDHIKNFLETEKKAMPRVKVGVSPE